MGSAPSTKASLLNRLPLLNALRFCALVASLSLAVPTSVVPADESFDRVAAIFEQHCIECHNENDRQGGLSLSSRSEFFEGADSGQVIDSAHIERSLIFEVITPVNGQARMPEDRPHLDPDSIQAIQSWLQAGTPWPEDRKLRRQQKMNTNWWSFLPLVKPTLPTIDEDLRAWAHNPIDYFVAAAHQQQGLTPAPAADRQTLIRRVYFNLIGLPPSQTEVQAFLSDDRPDAYEQLVDQLLASPAYGERWARHWLDVVHYGETHGYDKDQPRPNAWPYRDYVIRAFNADKPYGKFVQEQVAADAVSSDPVDRVEALGFIAAGPWDLIGHAEVPETKIDGKIARHLDRDDMLQNTMLTFQSITAGCAQCHDHKFDPVSQEDYYALQAIFAALDRADKEYYRDPRVQENADRLREAASKIEAKLARLEHQIRERAGEEYVTLESQIAEARSTKGVIPDKHGYHSNIEPAPDREKWVQVDLGRECEIANIAWIACHDDFNSIGAGFGYPKRFKITASNDPSFADSQTLIDQTQADVANPATVEQRLDVAVKARYVRFTATRLATRLNDYIFALAELKVLDAAGNNLAASGTVSALDSIEAPARWSTMNLIDQEYPRLAVAPDALKQLEARRDALIAVNVPAEWLRDRETSQDELSELRTEQSQLPAPERAYIGKIHTGSGTFVGTGANGGKPRTVLLLSRGDVKKPIKEVPPHVPSLLGTPSDEFQSSLELDDVGRRLGLARWLSDTRNGLTWRSIANRVWHYHFGVGIVDTPNDFGHMGGKPSHPELLDWLACELRDNSDQPLKSLHRLIVTSSSYRQSSVGDIAFEERDASNRYLWRMNRRRIEAEAIRDSMVAAAGQLDRQMGGPSYRDFVIERPEHSPHYEFRLHDPNDPKTMRRSIYRMIVRSQTQPFMTTLDCADPSSQVDRRGESNSALQALAMMNDSISLCMAQKFASRLESQFNDPNDQLTQACWLALSRAPKPDELQSLREYRDTFGLSNACRLLFNLNEFLFVD